MWMKQHERHVPLNIIRKGAFGHGAPIRLRLVEKRFPGASKKFDNFETRLEHGQASLRRAPTTAMTPG